MLANFSIYKHACVYLCVCICLCICAYMYVCGVPNKKLVSLTCMPNKPKSAKRKNGICIYVCLYVYICLCICAYMYVCGVPNIKLVSLHVCQMSQKVQNAKMVSVPVCACVCVYLYFCVIYKLSIFGMFAKSGRKCRM